MSKADDALSSVLTERERNLLPAIILSIKDPKSIQVCTVHSSPILGSSHSIYILGKRLKDQLSLLFAP